MEGESEPFALRVRTQRFDTVRRQNGLALALFAGLWLAIGVASAVYVVEHNQRPVTHLAAE